MRELWKGLTLLAMDRELRRDVFSAARFLDKPELEEGLAHANHALRRLHLRNQPDTSALRTIDKLYRQRGVFLGPYALAEINRWVLDGGKKFDEVLDAFRNEIANSAVVALTISNPAFLEAVGALVADEQLRDLFGKNETDLHNNGFSISPAEEAALRDTFVPASRADELADEIFRIGWSGSCLSSAMLYDSYLHLNM